jgi:hypothetical protein
MIRIADIQEAMQGLVGWEQDYDPTKWIDENLTESESGLFFQQAHPLMTLENIRSIMPESFLMQYPEWNSLIIYKEGRKVRHKGIVWEAKKENQGQEPPASDFNNDYSEDFGGEYWRAYNMLSDYLEHMTMGGIAQTVQTFLQMKGLLKESKSLLERRTFFDGAGRIDNTTPSGQRLVGFEITPVRSMGVTAKIERVGLQMTGAKGTVRLYLFHSSQRDPIAFMDVEIKKGNGSMEWFVLKDWHMPYISEHNDSGGCWFLCYNQADLPEGMEAVNVTKDWSTEPCGTCNRGSLDAWRELTRFLQISPFRVSSLETFKEYPELWDIADNVYTTTQNYGMNVEVTVACDLTDFIIEQRQMFATVLQRQVAVTALRTMAMNPNVRVNRNQSNVSLQNILYELDGNPEGRAGGLGYELKKGYEALDLDTRNIDRICMTCRPVGVKYTHV